MCVASMSYTLWFIGTSLLHFCLFWTYLVTESIAVPAFGIRKIFGNIYAFSVRGKTNTYTQYHSIYCEKSS